VVGPAEKIVSVLLRPKIDTAKHFLVYHKLFFKVPTFAVSPRVVMDIRDWVSNTCVCGIKKANIK
jgi:hypothetical protein